MINHPTPEKRLTQCGIECCYYFMTLVMALTASSTVYALDMYRLYIYIMSLFTLVLARARLRFFWAVLELSQQCEQSSARILLEPLSWASIRTVGCSHLCLSSGSTRLGLESEPSPSRAQCEKALYKCCEMCNICYEVVMQFCNRPNSCFLFLL